MLTGNIAPMSTLAALMRDVVVRASLMGLVITENCWLPEFSAVPCEDAAERFAAMTAHHLDLSLIPLTELERVVFVVDGDGVHCHPNTFQALRAAIEAPAP